MLSPLLLFPSHTTCPLCLCFGLPPHPTWQVAHHHEVYPGCKVKHFQRIHKRTGIPYEDMVFFDNEYRNVRDVQRLGVVCVHTPEGFRRKYFEQALRRMNED